MNSDIKPVSTDIEEQYRNLIDYIKTGYHHYKLAQSNKLNVSSGVTPSSFLPINCNPNSDKLLSTSQH